MPGRQNPLKAKWTTTKVEEGGGDRKKPEDTTM
jgi:hypothetical protein